MPRSTVFPGHKKRGIQEASLCGLYNPTGCDGAADVGWGMQGAHLASCSLVVSQGVGRMCPGAL